MAAVDACLREVEVPGFSGNTKDLITAAGASAELQPLRAQRNDLVHVNSENQALTFDNRWTDSAKLELEAHSAVRLMFEAFYLSPGT